MSLRCGMLSAAIVASLASAAGDPGIRPRASSSDYAAHETVGGVEIAASALAPEQVRRLFAADLNGAGYLVVEVAVYPEKEIDLSVGDFLLRSGSQTLRPVTGGAIAAILEEKNAPRHGNSRDATVYPSATIGYESGGYDPVTGRRTRGVYTGAGVGVAVGEPQPPGSASAGQHQELENEALPESKTSQPVAGYLYFPRPSGKGKNPNYELTWYGPAGQVKLHLPAPAK